MGATVVAEHLPTGTKYGTVTNPNGRYQIFNMKAGGPYSVAVSFIGFEAQKTNGVYLSLGNAFTYNFELESASNTLQEVAVRGVRDRKSVV